MKNLTLISSAIITLASLVIPSRVQAAATPPDTQGVVTGNTEFAVNLYDKLRAGDNNVIFSPYSISVALAMTYGGARGDTAQQMAHTLHFNLPPDKLHSSFAALEDNLNAAQKKGKIQLAIADSLWPQAGSPFLPDFLALCRTYYGASITPVDYKGHTEAARKTINSWVEDRTKRKIVNLLQPNTLDSSTRLVLVNAIYFKGNWESPFDAADTMKKASFQLSAEKTVTAPLMRQTDFFSYAETSELQILELPYEGGDLSMQVLLPRTVDGLGNLESKLTAQHLADWTAHLNSQKVHVYLPKFKMTSEFSLAAMLAVLGMPDAFDPSRADFSGMDGRKELNVSAVIHKAFVEVNEKGTEAAAATAVAVAPGAAAPSKEPPIPIFRADHPFLFLIRDNRNGSILFLGRITNPIQP
jgi:serpin B